MLFLFNTQFCNKFLKLINHHHKNHHSDGGRFIKVVKKAALVMINPDSAGMLPMHDPVANMVYSMQNENVEILMTDGCWLMRDHKILTTNEPEIIQEAKQLASVIPQQASIRLPNRFKVVDK